MSNVNDLMNQVRDGMDVYCSDGKKLGEVGDVNIGTAAGDLTGDTVTEERSFFEVRRGFLGLGDDLYIPAEVIQQVDDDRITLSCPSNAAEMEGWSTRPSTPGPGGGEGETTDVSGPAAGITATRARGGTGTTP